MKLALLFFLPLATFAQSIGLLKNLDSTYVAKNAIIGSHSVTSFFESGLGDRLIDVYAIDQELFNAALFFAINKARLDKNHPQLAYVNELEFLAFNCTQYYSLSVFQYPQKGRSKFEKVLYLSSVKGEAEGHLLSTNVVSPSLLAAPKNKKILKKARPSGEFEWFYKNGNEEDVLIKFLSYNALAEQVVQLFAKGSNRSFFYSSAFVAMGCYVQIDATSMKSSSGPKVKVIQIVSGKRFNAVGE